MPREEYFFSRLFLYTFTNRSLRYTFQIDKIISLRRLEELWQYQKNEHRNQRKACDVAIMAENRANLLPVLIANPLFLLTEHALHAVCIMEDK